MYANSILHTFVAPNLKTADMDFLLHNKSLTSLDLPSLEQAGSYFLYYNENLKSFSAPNLKEIKSHFMYFNKNLEVFDMSSLVELGMNFLNNNPKLAYEIQKAIDKKQQITSQNIANLDKENNITVSEVEIAGKLLDYTKEEQINDENRR